MKEISASLSKWFSERPQWLQNVTIRLIQQSDLPNISEIVTLCRQEANGELVKSTYSFSAGSISRGTEGNLRLCSISDVEGINALSPSKPLEFGNSNITIVYGNNGSGKTGYVRLLKHVCGARENDTLHPNVYKDSSVEQKACISFEHDGILKTHTWSGKGICNDLKSIDIFDTSFGKVFVSNEDEVRYEPPILLLFSSLIHVCEKVSLILDEETSRHQSTKPSFPIDKKLTPEGIWYESFTAETTSQEIDKHCSYGSSDETEIQTLRKRLTEQSPAEKARQLRKQKNHVDSLIADTKKYLEQLSDVNFRKIIAAKKKMIVKKSAADAAADQVFSGSPLKGIGTDVWKELWEAARHYSESTAYKEVSYPNVSEGSLCVLCHQTLTQLAKDRLISFESFVKGELQKAASDASIEYEKALQSIEALPSLETLKTKIDAAGIPQDDIIGQVMDFFAQLQSRKDQLPGIESEEEIPDSLLSPKWIEEANVFSMDLNITAEKYDEDAKSDNREEIKKNLESLEARKWLFVNRSSIDGEVIRLKLLNQIEEAKKLTNTKALSQKKGELAEELITKAFVQRFNTELKVLSASQVKVELVKSKVSKGRVLHKLQLRGVPRKGLSEILSEGEKRIVSIAAFLADVTGKSNRAPFIFDDPISSLDQIYEEAVVKRLIELSLDKQVIVFTHRLSLLGIFKYFTDKKDIKLDVVCIRSADWGTGEPASIPVSQSDIKTTLNILINKRYQAAKKALENGEFEHAEILLSSLCSDFRSLLERSIENDLLCGVVQRFQRPVHTMKLKDLGKLKNTDCELLNSLMDKYSPFEHSHSEESPVEMPKLDDLLGDMISLKTWREEYSKRPTSAVVV